MVTYPTELPSPRGFRAGHRIKIRDKGGALLEFELIESNGQLGWGAPRNSPASTGSGATGSRRVERRSTSTGQARTHTVAEARRLLGLPPKRSA